jgi:hypothetical protein
MGRRNKHKTMLQKAQCLKLSMISFARFRLFAKSRRAISPVVSNLILISVVLTVGVAALAFARSTSITYQTQYAQSIGSDIGRLKECLTFEYASYDGANHVSVYFMNSGSVAVTIAGVSVDNSPIDSFTVQPMNAAQQITDNVVGRGIEGYLVLDLSGITLQNGLNTIKITTESGSEFVYNILA